MVEDSSAGGAETDSRGGKTREQSGDRGGSSTDLSQESPSPSWLVEKKEEMEKRRKERSEIRRTSKVSSHRIRCKLHNSVQRLELTQVLSLSLLQPGNM